MEVYSIAEGVLAQRPGDLRSMANRALAADLLARLAMRRSDFVAASEYAAKSALAGENYVRFNPSDYNSWIYWVRGKDQMAAVLVEQGRMTDAIEALKATVALENDKRKPGSLGQMVWQSWNTLAYQQASVGQREAAELARRQAVLAIEETAAVEPEGSPRRQLYPLIGRALQARLQLMYHDDQAALDSASALIEQVRKVAAASDQLGGVMKANILRGALTTQTLAALQLGRYSIAEAAARERFDAAAEPVFGLRTAGGETRAQVTLAHALAGQGRVEDARKIMDVELPRNRERRKSGAKGLTFERDLAYSLYVSALAESTMPRQRPPQGRADGGGTGAGAHSG